MHEFGSLASAHGCQHLALLRGQQRSILVLYFKIVTAQFTARAALFAGNAMLHVVLPNVRVKPPAAAGGVSWMCEGAAGAAQPAYAACRSGSA